MTAEAVDRRAFLRGATAGAMALGLGPWPRRPWRDDTVLRGGVVYDGTGGPPRRADVAIRDDRVVDIGRDLTRSGATVIDVTDLAVAPGFVDIHSHTDLDLLVNPNAESKIRQGVTTEVTGQDGGSVGPWSDDAFATTRERYRTRYDVEVDFRDLRGFFARLRRAPASVNITSMVGAGTIRGAVIGADDRPATDRELDRMATLVADAVAAGACGLSSGLEYIPGAFATSAELARLAGELRGTGLPYASHLRNEDDRLLGAIEEALNVGRSAEVPVHVSHLKAQGQRNWWKAESALETVAAARSDGIDVTFDRYPYVAYSTGLGSLFPVWAREGGTAAFLARLADPSLQPRIERAVRAKVAQLGTWNSVQITSTGADDLAWARGNRLGDLARARRREPYALLEDLVRADRNRAGMVGFGMSEANTERILRHPLGMICSDAGARATYGPLASGTPHPRAYGSFPRVLGHYCRDRRSMSLETAIHKITAMPADRVRLAGRGRLAPNAFADLVVFDPDTVRDNATFEDPHQYPTGIPHVMVNGTWVVWEGEHTGARSGRVVTPGAGR